MAQQVKIWDTFMDYMGVIHIVTEISKRWVTHVDENGEVYKDDRLEFIDEFNGFRYYKFRKVECECGNGFIYTTY